MPHHNSASLLTSSYVLWSCCLEVIIFISVVTVNHLYMYPILIIRLAFIGFRDCDSFQLVGKILHKGLMSLTIIYMNSPSDCSSTWLFWCYFGTWLVVSYLLNVWIPPNILVTFYKLDLQSCSLDALAI